MTTLQTYVHKEGMQRTYVTVVQFIYRWFFTLYNKAYTYHKEIDSYKSEILKIFQACKCLCSVERNVSNDERHFYCTADLLTRAGPRFTKGKCVPTLC